MTLGAEWKGSKFGNLDNDIVPIKKMLCLRFLMMASSDGNIFSVIGLLWGEFTCHRWIPLTKESDSELWCFLWCAPEQTFEEKTLELPVIWDATTSMLRHCNVSPSSLSKMDIKRKLALQWHRNGCDGVSNHQTHDCLLNRLFRRRSKKTSKLHVTGLCAVNSPGTKFPAQMATNAENVSMWWRLHGIKPSLPHFISTTHSTYIKVLITCN